MIIAARGSCTLPKARLWAPSFSIILVALVAGCGVFGGGDKPKPVRVTGDEISTETVDLGNGYGLNLPKTLDGFTRTDTQDARRGADIVAGYARTLDPSPIIATVRVHQAASTGTLDILTGTTTGATPDHSAAAMTASIAQVRHFYPEASVVSSGPAYLVRFGAMQNGRRSILTYTDTINGVRQPIDLQIETFCCADAKWDYEFRFRYPASLAGVEDPIAKFLSDVAWSARPAESIDKPE